MIDKQYRYEKKFTLISSNIDEVYERYFSNLYPIEEIHTERKVNSIYFDNVNFDVYNDSISGVKDRIKTRVRWYGADNIVDPQLEFKLKNGDVGFKEIYPLKKIDINQPINRKMFDSNFRISALIKKHYIYLSQMNPILFCAYKRKYFISKDKKTRITIDKDLEYSPVNQVSNINSQKLKLGNIIIIELKSSIKDYENFSNSGQYIKSNQTRFSKYTFGIEKIYGNL